uniref:Bifunctional inhibitor/plant lipid transfer protein/seed storage helical domain-containing protein n=1 Tax=Tetradesmus obliquus TaxID=3088 RepID=A0A383V9L9_TETOB|eukprot:jgi/Sobl393_1/10817/SZX61871.1
MARTSALCVCAAALVLLLVASHAAAARPNLGAAAAGRQLLQDDKQKQCFDAFNQYGGVSGIAPRVPACNQQNFKLQDCCSQTKAALSLGPEGCLCDKAVWAEVERQMTSSGVQGLNSNSLKTFTRMCGIPNAGAGTC